MRIFIIVLYLLCIPICVGAQDFVDPSVNVGQIPINGTDRGRGGADQDAQGQQGAGQVLNPYDPKYRPLQKHQMDQQKQARESGDILEPLVSPSNFSVQFVRPADLKQSEIVLRVSQDVVVTGCVDVVMPSPKISFNGPQMRLFVMPPSLVLQRGLAHPDYECPKTNKMIFADTRLNLEPLKKQGTRQIVFKSEFGQDKYDMDIDQYSVRLSARTPNLFKGHSHVAARDPLTHIIYPQNTMMIAAPQLGGAKGGVGALQNFAAARNLTPLTDIVPAFNQRAAPPFFVVDKSGALFNMVNANEYTPIGTTSSTVLWHGAGGGYKKNTPIEVVAKRVGFYD